MKIKERCPRRTWIVRDYLLDDEHPGICCSGAPNGPENRDCFVVMPVVDDLHENVGIAGRHDTVEEVTRLQCHLMRYQIGKRSGPKLAEKYDVASTQTIYLIVQKYRREQARR
jgi:hypothetical protein